MKFSEIVDQAAEFLQQRKRVSYRALKREFDLDDESLKDVKAELIDAQRRTDAATNKQGAGSKKHGVSSKEQQTGSQEQRAASKKLKRVSSRPLKSPTSNKPSHSNCVR